MNTKEKIQFIASSDYVSKLHEHNLDFENHNRLFWCHLAAISFLTSGISEFNLGLSYHYVLSGNHLNHEDLGVKLNFDHLSLITTNNALIQFNNRCTRNGLKLNNPILGHFRCFEFKNILEDYINQNLKFKEMTDKEASNYKFNSLFLNFRIHNRKSEETQTNFMILLHEQCPEIDYFVNYLQTKDKLVPKNLPLTKKLKI